MSEIKEKSVEIKCPVPECNTTKTIKIPEYLFEKKQVGLIKIQIHEGICCQHKFIIFLDRKGGIKGYEQIDMQINLVDLANRTIGQQVFLKDLLKMYGEYSVGSIIHSVIMKYPIILLRHTDEKNRAPEINKLLNDFLPDNFKNPSATLSVEDKEYKKAKIEDSLVINPEGMLAQTPWNDIPLTFEQNVMRKALDILDDESQSVIIQQDLETLMKKAKFVTDIIKDKSQIYEDDLKELIKKEFSDNGMSDYDIIMLKQVVQRRFKGDINKIKIRSFDKLKQGLW